MNDVNFVNSFNIIGVEVAQIPCLTGHGEPLQNFALKIGLLYINEDNGDMYKCVKGNYGLVWKLVDSGRVTIDWEQNDSTAEDYIKNRPFHDGNYNSVYSNSTITCTINPTTGMVSATIYVQDQNIFELYPVGTSCKIYINGVKYSDIIHDNGTVKYIGNSHLISSDDVDTGDSFVIFSKTSNDIGFATNDTDYANTQMTLSLMVIDVESIHKLDPKYLPNNILKTEDKEEIEAKLIGKAGTGENSEIFNDASNISSGALSHSEGRMTKAVGRAGHAEGDSTVAGDASSVLATDITELEYYQDQVPGAASHSEGIGSLAKNAASHAEGFKTQASGNASHSEGQNTIASGVASHSEGLDTIADGKYSHSEGAKAIASGSLAEVKTTASGYGAHAEGIGTKSQGNGSHSEGVRSVAVLEGAHSEGSNTIASGTASHVEGMLSEAIGTASHAEGYNTQAQAYGSHTEGIDTVAKAIYAHAEGGGTIAGGKYSHVQGKYNTEDTEHKYSHIVGGGTSDTERKNIHTVDWDGTGWFAGGLKIGGSGQDDPEADTVLTEKRLKPIFFISSGKSGAYNALCYRDDPDKLVTVQEMVDIYFAGNGYFLSSANYNIPQKIIGFSISSSCTNGEIMPRFDTDINNETPYWNKTVYIYGSTTDLLKNTINGYLT